MLLTGLLKYSELERIWRNVSHG